MRLYGLIGYPLGHSFSKKYFTEKFEREGLYNCSYENYPIVSIEKLKGILEANPGLKGLNVTIPYKEQVIPFLDELNVVVQKIQACNCIKIVDGKFYGYNTDVIGFEQSLKKQLQSYHTKALILGTGGAAKSVAFVLEKLQVEFRFVSRKASLQNLSYEQVTPSILSTHLLIINTTPLGMFPHVAEIPFLPYDTLTPKHFLFDLIYNPAKTSFLQKGEDRGALIKNGYEMLAIQAEESWKIWNS